MRTHNVLEPVAINVSNRDPRHNTGKVLRIIVRALKTGHTAEIDLDGINGHEERLRVCHEIVNAIAVNVRDGNHWLTEHLRSGHRKHTWPTEHPASYAIRHKDAAGSQQRVEDRPHQVWKSVSVEVADFDD